MAIEIRNVSKSFGAKPVLENVSMTIPDKGIFGIFGPSGCGKTTLLRLIAGLEKPDKGEISGTKGLNFSFVFQEDRLLPQKTALENVAMFSDNDTAEYYLDLFGLSEGARKLPEELSGGMKRRTAVARALAYGGDILLLDEPFTGLEEDKCALLLAQFRKYSLEKPVLLVTHNDSLKQSADSYYCFS